MLFNNHNNSIFDSAVVDRLGMNGDGIFQVVGIAPEPQYIWDKEQQQYSDEINGYGIWVCQRDGNYQQNPIMVVVSGLTEKEANKYVFGESVVFENLGGFYSRRYHVYRWQADSISAAIKKGDKN